MSSANLLGVEAADGLALRVFRPERLEAGALSFLAASREISAIQWGGELWLMNNYCYVAFFQRVANLRACTEKHGDATALGHLTPFEGLEATTR